MADDFSAEAAATVRRHIEGGYGYLSWLNTRADAIERSRTMMAIPYDEKLTNTVSPPTVHGGIVTTFIDTAGGVALRTIFDDPLVGDVATVNLSANYPRRASGDLIAVAKVVRTDGSIGVSTITVVSTDPKEDSDMVARQSPSSDWNDAVITGQGAYRFLQE